MNSAHNIIHEMYGQESDIKTLNTEELFFTTAVFNSWSGKMSEAIENLGQSDDDKILTLQKKVAPKELLQPFRNLRAFVYNAMDKIAARFYALSDNTWVVTADGLEKVRDILLQAQADFDVVIQGFRLNYDREVEKYFEGKQFETQLRNSKLGVEDVIDKFKFSHSIFQLSSTGTSANLTDDTVFDSFVGSLSQQAEAIKTAMLKRQKKDILLAKSIDPLFELLAKAKSFAFVSPHAEAIANYLEKKLTLYTQGETITDATLITEAFIIAQTMSDRHSLLRFGDFVMSHDEFKSKNDVSLDLPPEWLELMGANISEELSATSNTTFLDAPDPDVFADKNESANFVLGNNESQDDTEKTSSDFFINQDDELFDVNTLPSLD